MHNLKGESKIKKKAINFVIELLAQKGIKYRPSDFERPTNFITVTDNEVLVHLGYMDEKNGAKLYSKRKSFQEEYIQVLTSYIIIHLPIKQLQLIPNDKIRLHNFNPARKDESLITYDERKVRYIKYLETRNMFDITIEFSEGELKMIVDSLADYVDLIRPIVDQEQCSSYYNALWRIQIDKINKVKKKIEKAIGYDRDFQLAKCQTENKKEQISNVGADSLELLLKR